VSAVRRVAQVYGVFVLTKRRRKMKFTIDRSKWRCGGDVRLEKSNDNRRGQGFTQLMNDLGFMCCLGQISVQLCESKGLPIYPIIGEGKPEDVGNMLNILEDDLEDEFRCWYEMYKEAGLITLEDNGELEGLCAANSELTKLAIGINDDNSLSDEERENKLVGLFADHGHEIEFVGEYVSFVE